MFEERPLSSWLDHHVPSSAANPPYGSLVVEDATPMIVDGMTSQRDEFLEIRRLETEPESHVK